MELAIKKVLLTAVIFSVMVVITLGADTTFGASGKDYVKVGLKYGNTAVTECSLTSSGGFLLGTVSRSGFQEEEDLSEYDTLKACMENGQINLKDSGGEVVVEGMQPGECLMAVRYETNGTVTLAGKPYRGGIMLRARDGKMTVINFLPADQYVKGVLHREMSQASPLEALKAQAVAARSFVINNLDRHKDYGFDVCDTTHCQVYGGYADEYPSTNQAVSETAGEILWYRGASVVAFYSKNSGGYTQNSEDVWGTAMGHLRAVRDEHSPTYPWTATISYDDLRQKLEQAGYQPGEILSISVGSRNAVGYVNELIIKGTDNTARLQKENIRYVLGSSLIRSRNFILAGEAGGGETSFETTLCVKGKKDTVTTSEPLSVLSGDGKSRTLATGNIYISNGKVTKKGVAGGTASDGGGSANGGNYPPAAAVDGAVAFSGLGYGHGVGMSQDGVIAMGQKGFDYIEILNYYFTDIEVR